LEVPSSATRIVALKPDPVKVVPDVVAVVVEAVVVAGIIKRIRGDDNRCRWVQEEEVVWAEAVEDKGLVRSGSVDARIADIPNHTSQVYRVLIRHVRNVDQ
jgi:hypothetical protein